MKKCCLLFLCTLLLSMTTSALLAQDSTGVDIFEMSLEELMGIEVVTASRQSEPLFKAPVPITVITREMIDAIGARHLKEVLTTYVPGLTPVEEADEMNVSMRGVYATSQQKILFMTNGNRMNSRVLSTMSPNNGINLDKVKQIEVVRGPGSSLYGNVSLTGVVNIITMKGEELEGTQFKGSIGNHGQRYASVVSGTSFGENNNVLIWGHHNTIEGEERAVKAASDYNSLTSKDGMAYIGAVDRTYDIGVQAQFGKFDLLINSMRTNYRQPFAGISGEIYDKANYGSLIGLKGGTLGQTLRWLKVGYGTSLGEFHIKADLYGENSSLDGSLITSTDSTTGGVDPNSSLALFWWERNIGGMTQVTYEYEKGSVLLGGQIEWIKLYDSYLGHYIRSLDIYEESLIPPIENGEEAIYSGFAQWKHNFSDDLLVNVGLRYDNKDRHTGAGVSAVSPRVAVIYSATDDHHLKLSYSKSFVDAPFWYRYNTLGSFSGSPNLKPENLQAVQLSLDSKILQSKAVNNLNFFYQSLTDIIFRDLEALPDEPDYINAGLLDSWGIEEQATFRSGRFDLMLNATYQHATDSKDYSVKGTKIANIPSFTGNIIGTYHILENLFFNLGVNYAGKQFSPIVGRGGDKDIPNHETDARFVINTGINYQIKGFTLDFRVKNILDTEYYQGGTTRFPYPQEGRWFTGTLKYKIKN